MPEHNAIGYQPELPRGTARLFGVSDPDGGITRLGETLTPVCDPWQRADAALAVGERILGQNLAQAAGGAGTQRQFFLVNDSTNVIAIVEAIQFIGAAAAGSYKVGVIGNTAAEVSGATVLTAGINRDTRMRRGTGMVAGRLIWRTAATVGPGLSVLFNTTYGLVLKCGIVIAPGAALAITDDAVAATGIVSCFYRERIALPGELPA